MEDTGSWLPHLDASGLFCLPDPVLELHGGTGLQIKPTAAVSAIPGEFAGTSVESVSPTLLIDPDALP